MMRNDTGEIEMNVICGIEFKRRSATRVIVRTAARGLKPTDNGNNNAMASRSDA